MSQGSYRSTWIADAFYNGRATLTGMPIEASGSVDGDASASVQSTARVTVLSDSVVFRGQGKTVAPTSAVDALATYGQEIVLSKQVWFGRTLIATIPYGRFRISEVPTIATYGRNQDGASWSTGAGVELRLEDRFEPIQAYKFTQFTSPQRQSPTVWSEVRRISPFPVTVSPLVADRSVSRSMVYDTDRLKTIADLFAVAGAEPAMTRTGSLTARPVDPFAAGISPVDLSGTMQPFTRKMSNDYYNHVIVTGTINGKDVVIAEAMIESGPLSVHGPAGHRVYERSSGLSDSKAGAQALADQVLADLMKSRASEVRIDCLPDLRLELGDPVVGRDPNTDESVRGTVANLSMPLNPTELMTVTIRTEVYA